MILKILGFIFDLYILLSMMGYVYVGVHSIFRLKRELCTIELIFGHWFLAHMCIFYRFGLATWNGKTYSQNGNKMF